MKGPWKTMTHHQIGLFIVGAGLVIVMIGLVVWSGGLSWFGHLPGDIRIERGTVRFFFPITSMVIVSAALSLLLYIIRRFF